MALMSVGIFAVLLIPNFVFNGEEFSYFNRCEFIRFINVYCSRI